MTHLLHLGASLRGDRSVSRMLGQDYDLKVPDFSMDMIAQGNTIFGSAACPMSR
jgi:hypothetical protein